MEWYFGGPGPHSHRPFMTRKMHMGMNVVACCDGRCRFTAFHTRFPGSVGDSRAFGLTRVGKRILEENSHDEPNSVFAFMQQHGFCFVGDPAFGDGDTMWVPHSGTLGGGPLGDIRRKCDHIQSRLRIRIEMAFGMLKMRFAILRRPFPAGLGLRRFVRTTKALGVLHNCKCHACTCSGATFLRCCCLCSDVAVMLLRCW